MLCRSLALYDCFMGTFCRSARAASVGGAGGVMGAHTIVMGWGDAEESIAAVCSSVTAEEFELVGPRRRYWC